MDKAFSQHNRSPSAQDALSSEYTGAKALQCTHQYGLAIDIVSFRKGEITYLSDENQSKLDSQKIGPIGQELGLEWGGLWKKKIGHISNYAQMLKLGEN